MITNSKSRWGIGALELRRQKEALPGEIMVDSETGVFAVKSYTGSGDTADKVVSYEYLSKVKQSFLNFKNTLAAVGRTGKIFKIDVDDHVGPKMIENKKSYAADTIDLTNKRVAYFQTYFDVDVINNETGLVENAIIPKIKISFNLAHNNYGGNDFVISFIDSIINLNNKTFVPDYTHFLDGNNSYHFHIDNFTISLNEQYDVEKYKIILHSIFIAFQEVE